MHRPALRWSILCSLTNASFWHHTEIQEEEEKVERRKSNVDGANRYCLGWPLL